MKTRFFQTILLIVISGLVGYYVGVSKISYDWKNYKPQIQISGKEPPSSIKNADFSQMWTVLQKLQSSYYDKKALDTEKLVNGAISGMVESLGDPYTVYLPPKQNKDFKEGLGTQEFSGIGAELGMKDKQVIVVAPLDGLPAQKAGILAGDAILKVDNQSTEGWTIAQAVEKIRGPKGTKVALSILHKGDEKPVTVEIIRDTILVKSVVGWVKQIKDINTIKKNAIDSEKQNDSVMYVRISQFGDETNQEWLSLINKLLLQRDKNGKTKGIIVDVRNNPGGYLTDATYIASEFIRDGAVVMQENANGERTNFPVSRKGLLTDLPVVVLINKGSASASEIVAGAIRDRRSGILIGETSFGKGTIQQAEDLGAGSGVHITIAKWLTPNGIWVHEKGLKPDIEVKVDEKDTSHDAVLEKAVEELVK